MNYHAGIMANYEENRYELVRQLAEMKQHKKDLMRAKEILSMVVQIAQRTTKAKVESLVTAAIRAVYDRDFKFLLRFKEERGVSVAKPIIVEGENEFNARDDLGGGMVDIISFALRLVMWSMRPHRTRATMILDEPLKFIGQGELMERAAHFIKTISSRLGIQFIILTHDHQLAEIADKAWSVRHERGKSVVDEIS